MSILTQMWKKWPIIKRKMNSRKRKKGANKNQKNIYEPRHKENKKSRTYIIKGRLLGQGKRFWPPKTKLPYLHTFDSTTISYANERWNSIDSIVA